ncbi:MAG: sporulation protein YunB [Clostridiales bacterium]|nr:sporulation protein YunB [Clostridiales bacterium]
MKRNRKKQRISIFVFLFFVLFLLVLYYTKIVNPVIKVYSEAEIRALSEKAVNLAVSNVINRTISYDTLIDINYTQTGEIVSFSANQHEINSITREIIKETQYEMKTLGEEGLALSLGTFTGMPFLLGKGPKIGFKLIPIGSVAGEFTSEFESVGINMTKHALFLYINIHVSMVMPIKSYDFYTTNQVLLAESIILGKVPEVYLSGESFKKTLNLVP